MKTLDYYKNATVSDDGVDMVGENTNNHIDFTKPEKIAHPNHYAVWKHLCGTEPIEIARHMTYNKGTALAYLMRSGYKEEEGYTFKEKEIEDLKKAVWHLNDEIKKLENS